MRTEKDIKTRIYMDALKGAIVEGNMDEIKDQYLQLREWVLNE